MTQPDGIPGATVALLRGVNVGGNNRLAMKDLTEVFRAAGCEDVTTYIQSGNVVFTAHPERCSRIPDLVANLILERHDIRTTAVLRTGLELKDVLGNNPFLPMAASEDHLHVLFLAEAPPEELIHTLDPNRSPPDAFRVRGREVFLHFPEGSARTKLTIEYFTRALRTTGTMRNWRTVTRLCEMANQPDRPTTAKS